MTEYDVVTKPDILFAVHDDEELPAADPVDEPAGFGARTARRLLRFLEAAL